MPKIPMNATNPFLKNRYADLGSVIEASRPILAKHGLAICQMPTRGESLVGVSTRLIHTSGEWLEDMILLPLVEEKGLKLGQVAGSIITYLRRYAWSAVLGLYADEDTDGNQPIGKPAEKPAEKPAASPVPTATPIEPGEEAEMRADIWRRLMANAEGNEPGAAVQLEILTAFTNKKTNETAPGVRSVDALRGMRLKIAYEKAKKRYPDEELLPEVGPDAPTT
jgi:hypothetical protein